ncbi:hypothetical protein O181_081110 [Austropuccinia psidii MF-1]|uniref:CCHC-type domain-containing protein n=1 Tax=Austropuccinia psidii MF-1 TaxID=1389203 RepID=A0A9Q3FIC3_9BASI|nr:hypothetical protein [Austropuccinia psidii MF-1]
MEATIQSNQMDVDKEEANPNPEVPSLPQERHIWRMPELPPHSPRSVPTNFDVNSEPELIHDNISTAEPFSSGSNRNILMPIQTLVQSSQRRGVRNMPKPLAGAMNSYLHIKSSLGQEKTIELLGGWSPLSCKDKLWRQRPQWHVPAPNQLQKYPKTSPKDLRRNREVPRTIKARAKAKPIGTDLTHRGTGPPNWILQLWTGVHHGQNSNVIFTQGAGEDEKDLSMRINHVQRSINVEIGKLDSKLTKITLDINDLKRHDKKYTEWYELTNAKFDSIINACSRVESTCQIQNDEMGDISIFKINYQLKILQDHVLKIVENTNQFATHLAKSDSERQKLKNEIILNVEQIHKNHEPHMPRHSTPLTEEKLPVKGSFTPLLGENVASVKDIPKLEEWPTFSGEGEYNRIEFIRTIDMLQEDFHILDEIIVGKLHSLFTRTAKKLYYMMRMDHGKHDWSWLKSEVITKWENNSWRFKMENSFENAIFNSGKDKPLTWFLKKKDRLSALHPHISDTMINMKILRKCGGEVEHSIKRRCVEPCSTEDYINAMEHIITRTGIGKTWSKIPMESKMVSKIPREDIIPEKPVLKCHRCGSTSHLANTCTKKTKINEVQVIEQAHCTEEKEESDHDSAISEETPVEDYPIENITAFFEVTEVHTHLPHYSEDFYNLINIQDARMCKTKPARGKGYTAGASCFTSVLMNDIEYKVNLDTGAFFTCVGKEYLQVILPEWKNHLLPIEGVQFSSSSNIMYPLGILDTNLVFPNPAGNIRVKTEIVEMN